MDRLLQLGQTLGDRYLLKKLLGQGKHHQTYWAEDRHQSQKSCVLRLWLCANPRLVSPASASQHANVLLSLKHPQWATLRQVFPLTLTDQSWLVTVEDYVEGVSYQELLNLRRSQGKLFTPAEVNQLFEQIIPILAFVHAQGINHGNLSLDHLILRKRDRIPVLVGGGFLPGATELFQHSQPLDANSSLQEPKSEQFVKTKTDLQQLASIFWELLTGRSYPPESSNSESSNSQSSTKQPAQTQPYQTQQILDALSPPLVSLLSPGLADQDSLPTAQALLQQINPTASATPASRPTSQVTLRVTEPVSATQLPLDSSPMSLSKSPQFPLYGCLGKIALVLALMLGSGAVGWFAARLWIHQLFSVSGTSDILQSPDQPQAQNSPQNPNLDTAISAEAIQRQTALRTRQQELGINRRYFKSLVDQLVTIQSSNSTEPTDANLQNPNSSDRSDRWDQTAAELLDKLALLSPDVLAKLGEYDRDGRDRQKQLVNQLNLSSRSLLDLANARFFSLFPNLANQSFENTPIEQVWDALIADTLKNLQAGNNYERLALKDGSDRLATQGTLEQGQGKAMVIRLPAQNQMTLSLQANGETQLSVYTPTGKTPILEDSLQKEWSGTLPETGFYEIVLVSKSPTAIAYQLQLTTTQSEAPIVSPEPLPSN